MSVTLDGIYVDGQKAKFHPEDILTEDASAYTEEIGTAVNAWMEENVTGGEQVTDTTLTLTGVPADAKVTGDEIGALKEEFTDVNETLEKRYTLIPNQSVRGNGEINPSVNGYSRTDYIPLDRVVKFKTSVALSNCGYFNDEHQSVSPFSTTSDEWVDRFPSDAKYVVFSALTETISACLFTINKDTYAKVVGADLAEIKNNLDAVFCEKTIESTPMATIKDGADDVSVSSAKMYFPLVQNGTGDPSPSNVRNFVTYNTVDIYKAKKNLYSGTVLHGYYDGNANYTADEKYRSINIPSLPAGVYTFSTDLATCVIKRFIVDTTVTWVNTETDHYTFVLAKKSRVRFTVCKQPTETIVTDPKFQIEIGTASTGIEQAEVDTISVIVDGADFCEGNVDLDYKTGVYTTNSSIAIVTITNDNIYSVGTTSGGVKYAELRNTGIDNIIDFEKITDIKSNMYLYSEDVPTSGGYIRRNPYNTQWYIFDDRFTNIDTAKSLVDAVPVKIAVPLAEASEKYVEAGKLSTYKGLNNIWTDYSDIELTYRADTALYIEEKSKKHLRIMVFGHSYSADSLSYVPFILLNYRITCEIYLYYRGNDSVDRLVAEWNDTASNGYDDLGIPHIRRYCHIDTRKSTRWDERYGLEGYSAKMVLEKAVSDGPLDLITLQTAPTEVYFTTNRTAPDPRKGYEPYVRQAIDLINQTYTGKYVLGWFCSYTRIAPYNGSTGYPAITGEAFDNRIDCLRAAESICKVEPFGMVIPAAAAVFNARTNVDLASTSVSDIGNLWYSDAVHLQSGIPMYVGNLCFVQSIFDKFFPGLSVLGDKTRITDEWEEEHRCLMPSIHGDVLTSSEALYELAQKCAVSACEHPFDITPIYSVSDNTELQFQDTLNRYWADALIDTSNIDNGQLTEQAPEA